MTATRPLDPDSPRGRELAEQLTQVFAEIRLAIQERARASGQDVGDPPRDDRTHREPNVDAEHRRRGDGEVVAEVWRWKVVVPAGTLKGISEHDARRIAVEHDGTVYRQHVTLYADGGEYIAPWEPA